MHTTEAHIHPAQPAKTFAQAGRIFLCLLALTIFGAASQAQYTQDATHILDASALQPPAGAHVAIVEFADLECPACAKANPLLKEVVAKYSIPWVRHDYLIPSHVWSRTAAINARWFDTQSKALGDEYRDQVFANQPSIYSLLMLRNFTAQFAQAHKITLPFSLDPQSKIENELQADNQMGRKTGITSTPTIFVVTSDAKGPHYLQVLDQSQLNQMVEKALAETAALNKPAAKAAAAKSGGKK